MNDDNYLMRYGVTIIMAITLLTVLLLFFHGPKDIPQNAIDTVNSFVRAEKRSDLAALQVLYAKKAIINVQEVSSDTQQSLRNYDLSSSSVGDLAKRTAATKKISTVTTFIKIFNMSGLIHASKSQPLVIPA